MTIQEQKNMLMDALVSKIIALKEYGLNQTDIAELVGTTRVTVNNIVNRRVDLSLDRIIELLELLGCKIEMSIKVVA